jgi:hypothetical protein
VVAITRDMLVCGAAGRCCSTLQGVVAERVVCRVCCTDAGSSRPSISRWPVTNLSGSTGDRQDAGRGASNGQRHQV